MGYTHYWNKKEIITDDDWGKFLFFTFGAIIESEGKTTLSGGGYYKDVPIKIVNGYGDEKTSPELTREMVCFNGVGKYSHETFEIVKKTSEAQPQRTDGFTFCKTAAKPYDVVVVACLYAAEKYQIIASWSSDGTEEDLKQGKELYEAIINYYPILCEKKG